MFPAPRESWPPHHQSTHAPSSLPFLPHLLKFLYVYNACGIWKNDREGHTKAPEQWLEGRPNFPQSAALQTTFSVRCRTLFQGVGTLTATRGRGETKIVLQISSPDICLLENIWWLKLQPDVFQHDLIQVGLWLLVKVPPLRDMNIELWVAYINLKVENTQYRKSTYLQSIF